MGLYLGNIRIPDIEVNQVKPPLIIHSNEDVREGSESEYPEGTIYIVMEGE